jgi:hypothetical protein
VDRSLSDSATEYIFWLNRWSDKPAIWSQVGHFKCIITQDQINVIPTENDSGGDLNVHLSVIEKCKINYLVQNPNHSVELILKNGRLILSPVNPFEPRPVLNVNHNEVSAMVGVIEALRLNMEPRIDPNPYLRQLGTKNRLKRFRALDQKWDAHTSPWNYYNLYGDKFLGLKIFVLVFLLITLSVAVMVGLVYELDILDII